MQERCAKTSESARNAQCRVSRCGRAGEANLLELPTVCPIAAIEPHVHGPRGVAVGHGGRVVASVIGEHAATYPDRRCK